MSRQVLRFVLVVSALGSVASECSDPPARSPIHETVDSISIDPGELCADPAGASVTITTVHTLTCNNADDCGRKFGDSVTVSVVHDGTDAIQTFEAPGGYDVSFTSDCLGFESQLTSTHPTEGPGRDIGHMFDDCTIGFEPSGALDGATLDYTLQIDMNNVEASATHTCPGQARYGPLMPVTVEAAGDICADGAAIAITGTGATKCLSSDQCTEGETLTFDYALEPFGERGSWPSVTLSNGDTQRLALHCRDAQTSIRGVLDGVEKQLGGTNTGCVISVNEDKVADAIDPYFRVSLWGADGQIEVDIPCP